MSASVESSWPARVGYDRAMAEADLFIDSTTPTVLVAGIRAALILTPGAEAREIPHDKAVAVLGCGIVPIVCHRKAVARRLGTAPFAARDLLELFAFVRPAQPCLPTVGGLADALDLARPDTLGEQARTLAAAARALLAELADTGAREDPDAPAIAAAMAQAGWPWAGAVLDRLGGADPAIAQAAGLRVWHRLPEASDHAPEAPSGTMAIEPADARRRLAELLGPNAEDRPGQADFASALTAAFVPRDNQDEPAVVIAEAGTGVGKTLGYIAPASLWAEKNGGPVWISTYTRNLQRQIDTELDRLYPDPVLKRRKVVIRKGRENYLCLLNLEDAVGRLGARGEDAVALGLVARWAARTRDGDLAGGDFPAWLADLLGPRNTVGLADRRGECIYSACAHYQKCFIERTVRRARRADIVVANHALVMTQAALGGLDDGFVPDRVVFDEGHHVFDAADSAFSARLSGQEGFDVRIWLLGPEDTRGRRARGLARRIEDIAAIDDATGERLATTLAAARILPGAGWHQRLADGTPRGAAEVFLAAIRQQVYARAKDARTPYDLEAATHPPVPGLIEAAAELATELGALIEPGRALAARLATMLEDRGEDFDTPTRNRIDAVARGLRRRIEGQLQAWREMLAALADETPEAFVDWFSVTRIEGRDIDVGMHRHWVDPTQPFAELVAGSTHGLVVTSATLRDGTGQVELDWRTAEARTGAAHLAAPALRVEAPSPFDYARLARVFIVTDVRKDDLGQVAGAYRALMEASGGGALGLFTAISRLRRVHERIAGTLEAEGLTLLAQHVDNLDTASLVDIFRAEEDFCLLGTDAVRDGVDVPGHSLRLIVFDRVPWARPSILHRARRAAFTDTRYDDLLARLRLKQAFGRLVRRADDQGVFVLLDPMMPSRLLGAFPPEVPVARLGLAEAAAETRAFLAR